MLEIEDSYWALDFDRAASFLGSYIQRVIQTEQTRLEASKIKNARFVQAIIENRVRKVLGVPRVFAQPKGQ